MRKWAICSSATANADIHIPTAFQPHSTFRISKDPEARGAWV